jgi:hypothetical protein
MTLIRDSVVMRRETLYRMLWYRCPACQDVGFSQRPADDHAESLSDDIVLPVRSVEINS